MNHPGIKAKTDKLKELQRALGANDSGMAELIGCTRQTYRRAIEGGTVSAAFIAKVSLKFQVPFDTYFETTSQTDKNAA